MQKTEAAAAAFGEDLCSVCKDIPFSEFEEYWFPRGSAEDIDKNRQEREQLEWSINGDFLSPQSTCSLCRLLASCCPNGLQGASSWHEAGFGDRGPSGPFLRIRSPNTNLRAEPPRLVIYYRPELEPPRYPPPGDCMITSVPRHVRELNYGDSSIVPLSSKLLGSDNHEFKTFRVDPKTADFERISTWLRICESKHQCVKSSGSLHCINGTRFIDCVTRTIIRIDDTRALPSINYVALSYV